MHGQLDMPKLMFSCSPSTHVQQTRNFVIKYDNFCYHGNIGQSDTDLDDNVQFG